MNNFHGILLAEDSAEDIELTLEALTEINLTNDLVTVRNGEEALDYLYHRNRFAGRSPGNPVLILLDIKMPKIDGLEVLKVIKSDEKLKTIPVVMLTSSSEEKDLIESYQNGVNAYVVKPVEFTEFLAAVKKLGVFWALINQPPPHSQN